MSKTFIPLTYETVLTIYETQNAVGFLKREFEDRLSKALNLKRISAPLFVEQNTGLNDDLNGTERAVEFDILETKTNAQVVHSLAKWKRLALHKYGFGVGEGIYTDMNAIRRDEEMDNLHSIYVDQWDWETVIHRSIRNVQFLKETVQYIVTAICETKKAVAAGYPKLKYELSDKVVFITTQELEDLYPGLTPKERENRFVKEHKTVFLMQIGDILASGNKHDGRAPDYDDWSLNGDLLFWCDVLDCAIEISSMGIRVDPEALELQLKKANCENRKEFLFHKMLLNYELPLTMGGGIGQSRLCMLILEKAHVGEVQVSVWDKDTLEICKKAGVVLL